MVAPALAADSRTSWERSIRRSRPVQWEGRAGSFIHLQGFVDSLSAGGISTILALAHGKMRVHPGFPSAEERASGALVLHGNPTLDQFEFLLALMDHPPTTDSWFWGTTLVLDLGVESHHRLVHAGPQWGSLLWQVLCLESVGIEVPMPLVAWALGRGSGVAYPLLPSTGGVNRWFGDRLDRSMALVVDGELTLGPVPEIPSHGDPNALGIPVAMSVDLLRLHAMGRRLLTNRNNPRPFHFFAAGDGTLGRRGDGPVDLTTRIRSGENLSDGPLALSLRAIWNHATMDYGNLLPDLDELDWWQTAQVLGHDWWVPGGAHDFRAHRARALGVQCKKRWQLQMGQGSQSWYLGTAHILSSDEWAMLSRAPAPFLPWAPDNVRGFKRALTRLVAHLGVPNLVEFLTAIHGLRGEHSGADAMDWMMALGNSPDPLALWEDIHRAMDEISPVLIFPLYLGASGPF